MLYAKEDKCLGCKAQALQPFLFLPIDSKCYSEFLLYSILLISLPKKRASCVLRHSKLVLCPKTTCSAEGWAILRSRTYLQNALAVFYEFLGK